MSKANRNRRVRDRLIARQRKNTVTIAEYFTKTECSRYILHDDGSKTLLDVTPYWHGKLPFNFIGWLEEDLGVKAATYGEIKRTLNITGLPASHGSSRLCGWTNVREQRDLA